MAEIITKQTEHFSAENLIPQNFSLPKPFIFYFFKSSVITPDNSDLYYKLYFCCKYLFLKSKIIPSFLVNITSSEVILRYKSKEIKCTKNYFNSATKNNIKFRIFDRTDDFFQSHVTDWLLPNIWRYEPRLLFLHSGASMNFKDFRRIVFNAERVVITQRKDYHPLGNVASVEEVLECMPNAWSIVLDFRKDFTEKTAEKMVNVKRFRKFGYFSLEIIPQNFNASAFAKFIQKHARANAKIILRCDESFSNEKIQKFKERIENEVLEKWEPQNEKPEFEIYRYPDFF